MCKKPKILVVGSFVMDQIVSVNKMPELGQTVLGTDFQKAPGGKGANQAVQLARLGAEVSMVGKLGRDANGDEMFRFCEEAGIDLSDMLFDNGPSGCSAIVLEKTDCGSIQNRIIVIPGANMTITKEEVAFIEEYITDFDMVVLQNEIPMEINETVAKYAFEKGVPVMLNPAPSAELSDAFLSHITFISPNESEAEDLTGVIIHKDDGTVVHERVEEAAAILLERGAPNVIITLGSEGVYWSTRGEEGFVEAVKGLTVVDPTAAGDSFIGAFCYSYCSGLSIEESAEFANKAAAVTVTRMGAMPSLPFINELE